MNHDEITAKIKRDLKEYENIYGMFDIPMEWPLKGDIEADKINMIVSSSNIRKATDELFYEMLEEYFFSDDFSVAKEEEIVKMFLSPETKQLIWDNGYEFGRFIRDWVNFKVNDSEFRKQLMECESIKKSLEERVQIAENNRAMREKEKAFEKNNQKRFYYTLSDLNEIIARFLKSEGYKCLHKVRLYTEDEYMAAADKHLLWPVVKHDDFSEGKDYFSDIADAYKALIKSVQNNYELINPTKDK